jgi:hypothetical protein
VAVTAQLADLAPATTYHYRVVATNAAGTTTGPDRLFATARRAVPAPPPSAPRPPVRAIAAPPQRMLAVTLSGHTLAISGAGGLTRAVVSVRNGRRKVAPIRSGTANVALRWSDVRSGRALSVALAGSKIRIELKPRKLRLSIGGGFARATAHVRRRAKTLAGGSLVPPTRALTLRLKKPRQPRADTVSVVVFP